MGGGLSSFCMSANSGYQDDESDWEPRKIRPSDDDCPGRIGEPDVDLKATAFIAKFHEARCTDPERQVIMV